MKTLLISFALYSLPPTAPLGGCPVLHGSHGGGGGQHLPLGCGCCFAAVLFPATAADPEPANSGGKAEVHSSPGHLVEGEEINS